MTVTELRSALAEHRNPGQPLLLADLLNDFDTLSGLLLGQMRSANWLNAYLLAAGINQIAEDYLHPDPLSLLRAAPVLRDLARPTGAFAVRGSHALSAGLVWAQRQSRGTRRLSSWQARFAGLVRALAAPALGWAEAGAASQEGLVASASALLAQSEGFPDRLRRAIVRLPSSFLSFDQRPEDLASLVGKFSQRGYPYDVPLLAVGVRTSGSYLAPLLAALLEQQGYRQVRILTLRPGRRLLPRERGLVQSVARAGGLALLVDDPPATGHTLAAAGGDLVRAGLPATSILLLLQLFGAADASPQALCAFDRITLAWDEWAVNRQLSPDAVRVAFGQLIDPDIAVQKVERIPLPPEPDERGHTRGLYRMQLARLSDHSHCDEMVEVEGAGLGYFGEHALKVATEMAAYMPTVYGLRDGLLYRKWLPQEQKLPIPARPGSPVARSIARYIAERQHRLAASQDAPRLLSGRTAAWEVASNILSTAFGPPGVLLRPGLIDPTVKKLLATQHPSIVDGAMDLSRWFVDAAAGGRLLKVDAARRDFSNHGLYCYDAVFDLAGAAAEEPYLEWPDELRNAYEALTHTAVDEPRWLLYELAHFWARARMGRLDELERGRASARALQRYFAHRFLADLPEPAAGPVCALDIDGVLEGGALGFPGLTLASALSLRALRGHGFRPLLATGRSLEEVRERCLFYGLAGGVAEYGAALYLRAGDRTVDLVTADERAAFERLRAALVQTPGITLDPAYCRSVRAFRYLGRRRRGLPGDLADQLLDATETRGMLLAVTGAGQTDFVAARVDKGMGLWALLTRLDDGDKAPCEVERPALAVGDTESDLPMLSMAALACVPAHAPRSARQPGIRVMRHAGQAGLAEAVELLIGHRPGDCPRCAVAPLSGSGRALEEILSAREAGPAALGSHVLRLAAYAPWRAS